MTTTDSAYAPSDTTPAAPILEAFDAIVASGSASETAGKQLQFIMEQIRGDALPFFKELRDFRPILQSPLATVVASFRDVEEILHREEIFSVSPYLPRMMGVIGPFVLSQDITPGYDHDISVMRLVVRRDDLTRVKDIVSGHAAGLVNELFQGQGPVDIVQTLTRKVPVRLAADYFGFAAPSDEQMMAWARACFREFFINLFNDPAVRAPAVTAGVEMRKCLDALLAARRAKESDCEDDVVARLLRLQRAGNVACVDEDDLCRTLMGLVVGMVETTSQAAIQALLVLFSRPDMLASAAAAAHADDDDT
ncbi:MAG: hypothetical protein WCE42_08105, partial [Rhizobium ruizarguesonis]